MAMVLSAGAVWLVADTRLFARWPSALGLGTAAIAAPGLALPSPQRSLLVASPWVNTPPLRAEDLRGKVVLVNFWTYSCINSLRPLPYVRAWASKYKDRGLVVIGVHTPEFGFEKDLANVRHAVAELGVTYPVVLDSDYATWNAFGNNAWPAFYFIGADGRVHRRLLGEGGYDQSERLLQKLLAEAQGAAVTDKIVPVAGQGSQAAPDWQHLGSEETYVGYAKAEGFASKGGFARDQARLYRPSGPLALNNWNLTGPWSVGGEFATLTGTSGSIAYRFHARDLNLVMAPPPGGRTVRFRVRVDGADPGPNHGFDTDAQGFGRLQEPRMYQLVRQTRAVADRTFEIEFLDKGARAYVFTFG
jgi:thiol-disulfide isomerase/thioredoxin